MTKNILLIIISFHLLPVFVYSQIVEKRSPFFTTASISSIDFLDEQNGFIMGHKGMMWKTTDGGTNWIDISLKINQRVLKVVKKNETEFFAISTGYSVYHSTNAGQNWKLYKPINLRIMVIDMCFTNDSTGYAVGKSEAILKTENGGDTWETLRINKYSNIDFHKIQVINTNVWVSDNHSVNIKSTDGGITWANIGGHTTSQYANDTIGYSHYLTFIYKTIDGGLSWYKVRSLSSAFIIQINVVDTNNIFLLVKESVIYEKNIIAKSTDGGETFDYISLPESPVLYCIDFLSARKGYAAGNSGYILLFSDNDITPLNGEATLNDIYAINNTTVITVGLNGKIYKSYNNGINWINIEGPTTENLRLVFFVNQTLGFIASLFDLYKTTDGGYSWQHILHSNTQINNINFLNENTGFILSLTKIYKTTNGGVNWNDIAGGVWMNNSLYFINETTGWTGNNKGFYKTSNSGLSWDSIAAPIKVLKFFSEQYGFVSDLDQKKEPSYTTDGGASWVKINLDTVVSADFIETSTYEVIDSSTIFFSTSSSPQGYFTPGRALFNFWKTSDKFNSAQDLLGHHIILKNTKFSFSNKNNGWFLAERNIYRINNIEVTDVKEENNTAIPTEFNLYQNYPNPFNPTTNFRFTIPTHSAGKSDLRFVELKIYDILGNEVTTLINEAREPGEYEIDFDGSRYSSGVYFYTLQAGEFTATKKFVLMK